MSPFRILYEPKSILGLLVASGILFLLIAGLSITVDERVYAFFLTVGAVLLGIGIVGWLFYIVPSVVRNLRRLR